MMIRIWAAAGLLLLTGCSNMGLAPESVFVMTKEYGQCVVNTKAMPGFKQKKVTYVCQDDRVLLGEVYTQEGTEYIDSALLQQKNRKYFIKERSRATVLRGLHSVCQLQPLKGDGDKSLKRYYFDIQRKECRPFTWSGKGGFVPFKNVDACEQYCNK